MKISPLTNAEMGGLLRELQEFWKKWRDSVDNTEDLWADIIYDANKIYRKYGDSGADLIASFIKQLEYRTVPESEAAEEKDYTH